MGTVGTVGTVGTGVLTGTTLVAAASSSPRYASDLEQARPQTSGEEELQLQLALAMSREEAEKVRPGSGQDACPFCRGRGPGRMMTLPWPTAAQNPLADVDGTESLTAMV